MVFYKFVILNTSNFNITIIIIIITAGHYQERSALYSSMNELIKWSLKICSINQSSTFNKLHSTFLNNTTEII